MKLNPQQVVNYATKAVGNRWVGTAIGIEGDVANVTHERNTEEEAQRAMEEWRNDPDAHDPDLPHSWVADPKGDFEVICTGSGKPRSTKK